MRGSLKTYHLIIIPLVAMILYLLAPSYFIKQDHTLYMNTNIKNINTNTIVLNLNSYEIRKKLLSKINSELPGYQISNIITDVIQGTSLLKLSLTSKKNLSNKQTEKLSKTIQGLINESIVITELNGNRLNQLIKYKKALESSKKIKTHSIEINIPFEFSSEELIQSEIELLKKNQLSSYYTSSTFTYERKNKPKIFIAFISILILIYSLLALMRYEKNVLTK